MKLPWSRRRQEIDEELRTHLQMAIRERVERGETQADAARNARREFGNELLIRETTRDMWGWMSLERFARDLRYVFRQIGRNPGFAAVSILTLALGLGATAALFSIVNSVLLEPLKYRDPGRLYAVVNLPPPNAPFRYWSVNGRHFHEWRTHCRSCEDVALAEGVGFTLTGFGEPERFPGLRVSYNFFRTFGVRPALGRDFQPEEERPGQFQQVILADSIWRARFSGDPRIVGRKLLIDGLSYTVIGVMPADFRLPVGNQWGPEGATVTQPLMFRPLGQDFSQARGAGNYNLLSVVRLKPGIQVQQTIAEFNALIAEFVREFKIELKPTLLPLQETVTRGARGGLWLLLATVGVVLLIACVNVANLMLVRTASRNREVGIRMALGSSRAQLFRLVLNEALVLVLTGSGLGLLLAYACVKSFVVWAPVDLPRLGEIHMGSRALFFTMAAAAISTLICGLLPAWRLARTDPYTSLKTNSAHITTHGRKLRLRELMVGAQVALSTMLLIIGGLLMLSFFRVMSTAKGFEVAHVITQDLSILGARYRDPDRIRFIDEALRQLAAIPGVRSAGVTNQIPLRGETWICDLRDAGPPGKSEIALANFRFVSPSYWETLGIPLKQGRLLEASDRNRQVAVLSERAAQLLWPGQNPIGKRVGNCGPESVEVVGVGGEVRAILERDAPLTVYQPYWNMPISRASFVLRTEADPAAIIAATRAVLRSMDAELPIPPATTMEQILDDVVAVRRFQMNLAIAFAISALLLVSLGIYGVISFTVARRTSELGIRIALGARAPELAGMVLLQGMMPVLAGLAAGVACALLTGQFIESLLYGVAPYEPLAISGVAILVIVVAACACAIPARRAMRIDPLTALRFE